MKQHSRLTEYLPTIEVAISRLGDAYVEHFLEEVLSPVSANLRIRVCFANGHLLEINEAVVVEADTLKHLDYRYHCQDAQNRLVSHTTVHRTFLTFPRFRTINICPARRLPQNVLRFRVYWLRRVLLRRSRYRVRIGREAILCRHQPEGGR